MADTATPRATCFLPISETIHTYDGGSMDTVWIKLHTTVEGRIEEETFMFGPTGIVRFKTKGSSTKLLNSNTIVVAEVREDSEYIMDVLVKMRGTKGRLDGEQKEKSGSKDKAPSRQKKS